MDGALVIQMILMRFTKHEHLIFDSLLNNYPNATLKTYGKEVGLPEGQMGNSEVGHLNIGAGRIVYQELSRINNSIESGAFFKIPSLINAFQKAKLAGKKHTLWA